ncbi:MAG: excinuclease ABC subunit C [Candidatus Kapabacteria bacterium]|nr:excinuclease ABC subunit C [Candidatus Kapabacteria bacterium]
MKDAQNDPNRHRLQSQADSMPTRPGVYLHKDDEGTIIYVGKAKNLRNRVRSYVQEGRPVDAKTAALMRKIHDIEFIVTDTEVEALILENTLIKQHKPKYNILLKDDKSYPFIRITKEPFPRVFKTRQVIKDGSTYFGPYTDGTYLYHLLKTLRSVFPLRSCDFPLTEQGIAEHRWKLCLDYHIKKCDGPCEGLISAVRYNDYIRQATQILQGRTKELEAQLNERMHELAEDLRFEDAEVVRQRLERLRSYSSRQKVLTSDNRDQDVFALARSEATACTLVLTIRDGKLVGKRHYIITGVRERTDEELLATTIERWYIDADSVPDQVLLPFEIESADVVAEYLHTRRGGHVEVTIPKIGDKRKLVALAEQNADVLLKEVLSQQAAKDQTVSKAVLALQKDLRMDRLPRRIDCVDNSHMQGTDYVSSVVVFIDGKPRKSEYRHYKLRTLAGNDDFEAMKEVLSRRFAPFDENGQPRDVVYPDLLVIDGGKGQLSHAMEVIVALGLEGKFVVVGLAKRLEEVFVPKSSTPLYMPKTSASLRLLQQVRDEAHRFAVRYHRILRTKRTLQTELTSIAGVGQKTATSLLTTLGSVEAVRGSSVEQLMSIVTRAQAESIYAHFHPVQDAG